LEDNVFQEEIYLWKNKEDENVYHWIIHMKELNTNHVEAIKPNKS
jgi:hypothetical protein